MATDGSKNKPVTHNCRTYRQWVQNGLVPMRVTVQETDLSIYADVEVAQAAKEAVITQRGYLEQYIKGHPDFMHTMDPWPNDPMAASIVREMIDAGRGTGVGPMAAVAGAMAQQVGETLLDSAQEVVVENGGDVFLNCRQDLTVAVYANRSPLSLKVGLRIAADAMPAAVCTSSGTVGHSISKGVADAVCVVSASCALADAAATAIGNRVQGVQDIEIAIAWGKTIRGIDGGLVIVGDKMGAWGQIELVPV